MKRLLPIITILFLVIGMSANAGAVSAQATWTCTYNFAFSDGGFSTEYFGAYTPGVGWTTTYYAVGGGYRGIYIRLTFPEATTLTNASYVFLYTAGTINPYSGDTSSYLAGSSNVLIQRIVPDLPTSPESWSGSVSSTNITLSILSGVNPGLVPSDPGGSVTLTSLILIGTGDAPCIALPVASFVPLPNTGDAPLLVDFNNESTGSTSYFWDFGDGNSSYATNPQKQFDTPGIYTVTLAAYNDDGVSSYFSDTVEVGHPFGNLYKPLATPDQDTNFVYPVGKNGLFDFVYAKDLDAQDGGYEPLGIKALEFFRNLKESIVQPITAADESVVTAISPAPDRPIHSISSGKVTKVEPVTGCGNERIERCIFHVPRSMGDTINDLIVRAELADAFVVYVSISGREVHYLINNPQVKVGDNVDPGCIIGYTIRSYRLTTFELSGYQESVGGSINLEGNIEVQVGTQYTYNLVSQILPYGFAFIRLVDEQGQTLPLLENLTQDSTSLTPCNADANHKTCQGDGSLAQPNLWTKSGGVSWTTGGKPTLAPGAAITEQLALSPDLEYSMSVQARGTGASRVTLTIGQTTQTFTTTPSIGSYTITPSMHVADAGLFYSVSVLNSGSTAIEISSVCVSQGNGGGDTGSTCVFENPSLDNGGAHWSTSEAAYAGRTDGELAFADNGTLSQMIKLYPGTYDISLRISVVGSGDLQAIGSYLGFEWSYDGSTWTSFVADDGGDSYSYASFAYSYASITTSPIPVLDLSERVFTSTIPVSTVTNGTFTIRANISLHSGFSTTNGGGLALVREVCIPSDTGGGGATGGAGGPIPYDSL